MMKKQTQLALAGVALGVVSLIAGPRSATAQQAPFPTMARGINTWMARAMDKCDPSLVSVINQAPGVPTSGCYQKNLSSTDNTMGMKHTKLRVTNRGKIAVYGTGFQLGDVLRVRLTLRVTQHGVATKHPPNGQTNVTFQDVTVDCPKAPDAFNVRPSGVLTGSTSLAACLAPDGGLAKGNVEVLAVSLVNAVSPFRTVAVPGILE